MTRKDDFGAKTKRIMDLMHESQLVSTILSYGRSGHASEAMIEAAIVLTERNIATAKDLGDAAMEQTAARLKVGLAQVLVDGVASLRRSKPPGPEKTDVEEPLVKQRRALGHRVRQQIRCKGGVVDIYDLTTDELIECKAVGSSAALGEAAGQLQRYRISFPGAAIAIAVPQIEGEATWLAELLRDRGITIIEISRGAA